MTQQVKELAAKSRVLSLIPTGWKERTVGSMLSSDNHTHIVARFVHV